MTWSASLAPLREPNFRYYFLSRLVNMIGNAMASLALAFAVLKVTDDDPAAVGYVLAAHTLPMVLLLLWGGVVADRFGRVAVLQFSNITSAVSQGIIAALVITGTAELWSLIVLSLVHGIVSGVGFPAMASMLPSVVPKEHLQPANALVSLARSGIVIIGPTVAALLVVSVGPGWALAVDATTWLVSGLLLGLVRLPTVVRHERSGLLVDTHDDTDWARALGRVLTEPGLHDRLAAGAAAQAREFSWDATAGAMLETYERARQLMRAEVTA